MINKILSGRRRLVFGPVMVFAVLLVVVGPAVAIQFSPIEMSFTPTGKASVRTFRLENDTDETVAVEIGMFARGMTPNGDDELVSAEDDFVVVPEQVVLMAGEVQWIRVQWIGNPAPEKEMAFRLIAEQLPIDIGERPDIQGGVIRLLVRYLASVYVVPDGAGPEIKVISATQIAEPEQAPGLLVELRNTGNAHQVLNTIRLVIKSRKSLEVTSVVLTANHLTALGGRNILAGVTRQFKLAWPPGIPVGPVDVSIEFPLP